MTIHIPSGAKLIKRVPRSPDAPYACIDADHVPTDTPAIVAFGGELTRTPRDANSYANLLQRLAEENKILNGIDFYSVVYDFGSRTPGLERAEQFRIAGRRVVNDIHPLLQQERNDAIRAMNHNEPTANYVVQLYNILLRPRIVSEYDMKTNIFQTVEKLHRIMFYAHCHGASTIWQMGRYMHADMIQMGFAPRDIRRIQQELLVIQHSPIAPLDNQYFTTLSFASAEDTMMQNHNNMFSRWMDENSSDVIPAYFAHGNLFVAGHLNEMSFQEHDHSGILYSADTSWPLTHDGRVIFTAERNALVHGIKNMIAGAPDLPSVAKLVNGDIVDFNQLQESGERLYKIMLGDLRRQNSRRDHQK